MAFLYVTATLLTALSLIFCFKQCFYCLGPVDSLSTVVECEACPALVKKSFFHVTCAMENRLYICEGDWPRSIHIYCEECSTNAYHNHWVGFSSNILSSRTPTICTCTTFVSVVYSFLLLASINTSFNTSLSCLQLIIPKVLACGKRLTFKNS